MKKGLKKRCNKQSRTGKMLRAEWKGNSRGRRNILTQDQTFRLEALVDQQNKETMSSRIIHLKNQMVHHYTVIRNWKSSQMMNMMRNLQGHQKYRKS